MRIDDNEKEKIASLLIDEFRDLGNAIVCDHPELKPTKEILDYFLDEFANGEIRRAAEQNGFDKEAIDRIAFGNALLSMFEYGIGIGAKFSKLDK